MPKSFPGALIIENAATLKGNCLLYIEIRPRKLKKQDILFLFLLLLLCPQIKAQLNNNWYFGHHAAITFNPVPGQSVPSAIFNSAMKADEGSASISDSNGQLLFYTNGLKIFNRYHEVMLNGDNLDGNISACQSSLIVPNPGNDSIFYVFVSDALENQYGNGYTYSIVNMKSDNGRGAVILKNQMLWPSCTERLTAARHYNGTEIWLITNDKNSNTFRAWKVSCSGIDPNPVISNVGVVMDQHVLTNTGSMKISPDGKLLCQTHFPFFDESNYIPNYVQLFDFDNATGIISNPRSIGFPDAQIMACEFSPDSKLLYLSRPKDHAIDQVECNLPTAAAIAASRFTIPTGTNAYYGIQLGPDEKIYLSAQYSRYLGAIQFPSVKGPGCSYREDDTDLTNYSAYLGLTGLISEGAYDPNNGFVYTIIDSCSGRVQFNGFTTMPGTLTWSWDFGDGNTSSAQNPLHTFNPLNRPYAVKLTVRSSNQCGELVRSRIIRPAGVVSDVNFSFIKKCDSGYVRFTNSSPQLQNVTGQFVWDFGDGTNSTDLHPIHSYLAPGLYTVKLKLTTPVACLDDSLSMTVNMQEFIVNASPDQTIMIGQPVQLSVNGVAQSYQWTPPTGLSNPVISRPTALPLEDIVYTVTAIDKDGCKSMDSVKITVIQLNDIYVPSGFTPDNNGRNDHIKPLFPAKYTLKNFSIFSRWGQRLFSTNQRGQGWDGKTDGIPQAAGVYVWSFQAVENNGKTVVRKGTILLIR